MAATSASNEWESTLGALRKLLAGRAAAREKEESGLGLFGDGKAARSGREVAGMVGEWMEGVEEAWEEE
jgi:hypothetical protein